MTGRVIQPLGHVQPKPCGQCGRNGFGYLECTRCGRWNILRHQHPRICEECWAADATPKIAHKLRESITALTDEDLFRHRGMINEVLSRVAAVND